MSMDLVRMTFAAATSAPPSTAGAGQAWSDPGAVAETTNAEPPLPPPGEDPPVTPASGPAGVVPAEQTAKAAQTEGAKVPPKTSTPMRKNPPGPPAPKTVGGP